MIKKYSIHSIESLKNSIEQFIENDSFEKGLFSKRYGSGLHFIRCNEKYAIAKYNSQSEKSKDTIGKSNPVITYILFHFNYKNNSVNVFCIPNVWFIAIVMLLCFLFDEQLYDIKYLIVSILLFVIGISFLFFIDYKNLKKSEKSVDEFMKSR